MRCSEDQCYFTKKSRIPAGPLKSLNLKTANSRPCKSLKMKVVLEKVLEYNLLVLENFDWLMEGYSFELFTVLL